jgi:hypothetical protein
MGGYSCNMENVQKDLIQEYHIIKIREVKALRRQNCGNDCMEHHQDRGSGIYRKEEE